MKQYFMIRLSSILAFPLIILQFILFSFNTSNADMPHYLVRFNNVALLGPRYFNNAVDILFNYLIFWVQKFSMDYQVFLTVCGVIVFYFLLSICRYYKINQFIFFTFFMVTTFFIEAVIVRQFLASALIAYTFTFYEKESKRYSLLIWALLLAACALHITSFLGILYYLGSKFSVRRLISLSTLGTIVSFPVVTLLLPRLTAILGSKFALYTSSAGESWVSFAAKTLYLVVTSLLMFFIYRYMNRNQIEFSDRQKQVALLSLKSSLINFVFLPLMRVDISFERLLIVPIFFYLLTISALFNARVKIPYYKVLLWLFCVAWALMTFRIFVYSDRLGTIDALLHYNLLW